MSLDKAIDAVMLSRYMPASVIINRQLEILQFRGATELYISPRTSKATLNILKMTYPEVAFELRSAISKAFKSKRSVRKSGIEINLNDVIRSISIEMVPLKIEGAEPVLLILFSEQLQPVQIDTEKINFKDKKGNSAAKDRIIKRLEEELEAVQAQFLAYSQEQEAFNEELQSANEEVVSSNEELQTINEELETSQEEIESVNEELSTTNQELLTRNELLNESYTYSEAVSATIRKSMLVLHKNLRVKSANESFYKTFAVRPEETEGMLLYDLENGQWNIPKLRVLLNKIISGNGQFRDFEVECEYETIGKKTMLLNASRINQKAHFEQLILLSITDITEIRKVAILQAKIEADKEVKKISQEKLEAEKISELFHFIANAMPQKVWTADEHGNRNYFNNQWLDYTGLSLEELQNEGWKKIIHPDDLPKTNKIWKLALLSGKDFEVEDRKRDRNGQYQWHLSRATAFKDEAGKIKLWVGTNTEVEKQKKNRWNLRTQ